MPKKSVLIVEDLKELCTALMDLMNRYGYAATCATTFQKALEQVETRRFHVAIIDAHLGAKSGLDLARRLSTIAPEVKIIVISGYPLTSAMKRDPVLRKFKLLGKPFTPTELHECVRQMMGQSAA